MAAGKTKVLIVEKEGLFRDLLARTLRGEAGMDVVGTAGDGEAALSLSMELAPDIVLIRVSPPLNFDAIELGQQIRRERPQTGITILTQATGRPVPDVTRVDGPGWCFLLAESAATLPVLARAIESSAMGLMVIDPRLLTGHSNEEQSRPGRLSPRLRAVLELMDQGYNNRTITQRLKPLGHKSIENYINRVYKELGILRNGPWHARVKAVLTYLEEGRARTIAQ